MSILVSKGDSSQFSSHQESIAKVVIVVVVKSVSVVVMLKPVIVVSVVVVSEELDEGISTAASDALSPPHRSNNTQLTEIKQTPLTAKQGLVNLGSHTGRESPASSGPPVALPSRSEAVKACQPSHTGSRAQIPPRLQEVGSTARWWTGRLGERKQAQRFDESSLLVDSHRRCMVRRQGGLAVCRLGGMLKLVVWMKKRREGAERR